MEYNLIQNVDDYHLISFELLKQLEGVEAGAYFDSDGVVTIGVGFNIEVSEHLDLVMAAMGFTRAEIIDPSPTGYRQRLVNEFGSHGNDKDALRAALNAIMAERAGAVADGRTTFTLTDAEMRSIFEDNLRAGYEATVNAWLSGIPNSFERAVLYSLAFNQQTGNPLLGVGLRTAIQAGDRAEAWFEIRYRSNGDGEGGIAKRRYIESQVFGLFDDRDTTFAEHKESLDAFRMFTRHEDRILTYDKEWATVLNTDIAALANQDLTELKATLAALTYADPSLHPEQVLGSVQDRKAAMKAAFDYLVAWYGTTRDGLDADLTDAGFTSSDFSSSAIRNVFVAVNASKDDGSEVDPHTVDREAQHADTLWSDNNDRTHNGDEATRENDLIIGSIKDDDSGEFSDADDTLKGGAGDDIIIDDGAPTDFWRIRMLRYFPTLRNTARPRPRIQLP